jgi:ABC-type transporter Mla MlaB component
VALSEPTAQPTAATVTVTGPVTRTEVSHWRDRLATALSRGQGLRLDLAAAGPWDVAGLQLLLAAIASAQCAGAPIVLARVPQVLKTLADRAGLFDRLRAICVD